LSTHQGIVLRAHSGQYAVWDDAGVAHCRARRRLERPDSNHPEYPVPGDEVGWRLLSRAGSRREGVIETVRPRRNEIARSRFGSKQVVIANLDQLVVVVATRTPALDRGLLDRLLAAAESNRIHALVCLHKSDLAAPGELDSVRQIYARIGYPVLATSVESGEGVDALRDALRDRTSAFMGPSGAGKSRLLSLLQPGLQLRIGSVQEKTGQGRHTTTRVDLHPTDFGGLLADTPGVRDFELWRLEPESLRDLFPEFHAPQHDCRFATCSHLQEPGCAVKAAVEAGDIDAGRYRSYAAILAERYDARRGSPDREGRSRRERVG
jgi:ribosome biogenesis GTPase